MTTMFDIILKIIGFLAKLAGILFAIAIVCLTISCALGAIGSAVGIFAAGASTGNADVAWFCTKSAIGIVVMVILGAWWLLK